MNRLRWKHVVGQAEGGGKQESIWIEAACLATPVSHPFYERLKRLLDKRGFDAFAEDACRSFYATVCRPGLAPGVCFRALLVGYFEGIDSERGIACRTFGSFLGFDVSETTPDHSTISRTRRLKKQAESAWVSARAESLGMRPTLGPHGHDSFRELPGFNVFCRVLPWS